MAEAFEPPPVMYTLASAVSLFKDEAPPSSGAIDDVDMTIDDATDSTQQSQQQAPAAARTRRRWEVEEDQEHHQSAADHKQQQDSTQPAPAAAGSAREVQRGGSSSPEGVGHEPGDGTANSSRPVKKARFSGQLDSTSNGLDIDHEALLAGVNQVLEQLDAGGATANGFHDLSDDVGRGPRAAGASSMSLGASYNSQGSKGGILKGSSTSGSVKKKVTWPDLPMEEDQQATGFRIAPIQRQLEEVYWVSGLGPPKTLWLGGGVLTGGAGSAVGGVGEEEQQQAAAGTGVSRHSSFAEQVRAEHKSEHNLFRAVLLGQVKGGPHKRSAKY
eukprot:GHUV01026407.1.p1 GENE.GHUV01026407.1~~GHUV01026407.1.p1  ORF type:complete len:329 (+),score=119.17 GHUV01026407.1:533-1519(+)